MIAKATAVHFLDPNSNCTTVDQCHQRQTPSVRIVRRRILLIRVLIGWVFLSEGIQRFLFPDSLGVGRFVKICIPWPAANGFVKCNREGSSCSIYDPRTVFHPLLKPLQVAIRVA